MYSFFQQNPFVTHPLSDLENDAELALHLVMFLLSTQNTDDGVWRDTSTGSTLRNTCHALESLHLLGLENSSGALETGVTWLVNLSDTFETPVSDDDTIRMIGCQVDVVNDPADVTEIINWYMGFYR